MKNLWKLGFALALLLAVSSCYKDSKEDVYKEFLDPCSANDGSGPSYSSDIDAILTTKCGYSDCHGSPTKQSGLDLTTYNDARLIALNGKLVTRITATDGTKMPVASRTQLTQTEIDLLTQWAESGACEN